MSTQMENHLRKRMTDLETFVRKIRDTTECDPDAGYDKRCRHCEALSLVGGKRRDPDPEPLAHGVACECGAPLPWHLFKHGPTRHTCSCERTYKIVDGKPVPDGFQDNPFTATGPRPTPLEPA